MRYVDPLGLDFSYSSRAAPYVAELQAQSPTAANIIAAMTADPKTNYYVSVGSVSANSGGGETTVLQPQASLFDRLLDKPLPKATVAMTVDPNSKVVFTDTCGKGFVPSTNRLLGHELGHGYTYALDGPVGYRANYDAAIGYENTIAQELDPSAPVRAVSDHGNNLPW